MTESDASRRSFLDADTLRQILRQLEGTDVDELEVSAGSSRLYLRREPGRIAGSAGPEHGGWSVESDGVAVTAPLTGVFYARPSPEQPPFINPGDRVEAGQVVALIETMKLFNEVTAEVGGQVLSIIPAEGDLVEAGAPLLYVRPDAGGGES